MLYFCQTVDEPRFHHSVSLDEVGHLMFWQRRVVKLQRANHSP